MFHLKIFTAAWRRWNEDNAGMMAAAVAYNISLSMLPTLLLVASGFGLFLKWTDSGHEAHGYVLEIVSEQANPTVAESIDHVLDDVEDLAVYSGPLGLITLLMASLAIFLQLDRAFDRIYRIPTLKTGNPLALGGMVLRYRLRAFVMLLALGLVVISIFVLGLAFAWFQDHATSLAPGTLRFWWLVETIVECAMNSLVFALIYWLVPKIRVRWRHALAGGIVAALMWELGRQFLGSFFIGERYTSAYGIIGAMTGLMLWGYGGIAVLFAGAEYAQVLATNAGDVLVPKPVQDQLDRKSTKGERSESSPIFSWLRIYDIGFVVLVVYVGSFFAWQFASCKPADQFTSVQNSESGVQEVVIFSHTPLIQNAARTIYQPLIWLMPDKRIFPSGKEAAVLTAQESVPLRH